MALLTVTIRGAGLVLAGIVCAAGVAVLPGLGIKALVGLAGVAAAVGLAVSLGRPREVLLAAYIAALSYNRQYYSFDAIFGDSGTQGLYWIVADPILVMLLLSPLVSRDDTPRDHAPLGAVLTPIMPFLFVCCVSTLLAERPDWAANDTYRVIKFAILLAWLHWNMSRSLWLTAIVTLAVVGLLQSLLGLAQVLLKGEASLLAMAGLATQTGGIEVEIENRARGTLGHPNMFAPYLLMLVPAAFGMALFTRQRLLCLLCLGLTAAGLIGVFVSKSRAPIALVGFALVLVALTAVHLRALSMRVFLGSAIVLTAIGAIAILPLLEQIIERIEGDLVSSVNFRADFNTAATLIWNDHPIWGIGPNNLNLELRQHFPLLADLVRDTEQFRDVGNVRSPTVHNVYYLMLAETGLAGLAAFLFLVGSSLTRAVGAAARTDGAVRGLCIGIAIGLFAQFLQQMVDFSLWYDVCWFTFAILLAIVGTAARHAPPIR